jgi:Spy/CpxP family protein refolding chaperone
MRFVTTTILAAMLSSAAQAQSHQHQPYAGLQARSIKALSEQQIADLRDSKGMGLALAAELNGYPGPVHVLEQADALNLTDQQTRAIKQLFAAMKQETATIGDRLIRQEGQLDAMFAHHDIDFEKLSHMTRAIGQTQAELRAAHLKYHLNTEQLLTAEQNKHYAALRGYAAKP